MPDRSVNSRVLLIEARRHIETAVRHRPDHVRYLELLGEACLVCGDSLAAIPHLERVLARDRSPRASWLLSWAYVHASRLADVERLVREMIEDGRGCARAVYVRGLARFRRRAFDLAIEDFREAMPDEVDVPFFRRELARALIGAALQTSASGPLGARAAPQATRQQHLRDAIALLRSGDIDDVRTADERKYLWGCALLELGESTRALSVLAETDYPSRAEASYRRGVAAAWEGDVATARTCFGEACQSGDLEVAANDALVALAGATTLAGATIVPPAIAPLGLGALSSTALIPIVIRGEGWPASPWAFGQRAPRDPAQPATRSAEATLLYDDPEDPLETLRDALKARRFDPDAIADCVTVLESEQLAPDVRRRLLLALAVALQIDMKRPMQEVERLVPELARVRRAAPGLAFPRLYLGRYWFRVGDYRRAVEEIGGLGGGLPRRPAVLNILGRAHEKLGRLEQAESLFRKSLRRKPEQPTILYSLSRLLLALYRQSCVDATPATRDDGRAPGAA